MHTSEYTQDLAVPNNLITHNERELLLKLSNACNEIVLLLNDEQGNLYKLIKNKKNKFAKTELNQLYEKFNYFLAVVSLLNEECNLGYSPNKEYIEKKIVAKNQHLNSCFETYRLSMDSNFLRRLKRFWCGGENLHIGIYVINYDISFTCAKIKHEISMVFTDGWDARRWHKYDYHSNNKKLLIYRINKLTALIKLQNMVYNGNCYSIDEEKIEQIKTKICESRIVYT